MQPRQKKRKIVEFHRKIKGKSISSSPKFVAATFIFTNSSIVWQRTLLEFFLEKFDVSGHSTPSVHIGPCSPTWAVCCLPLSEDELSSVEQAGLAPNGRERKSLKFSHSMNTNHFCRHQFAPTLQQQTDADIPSLDPAGCVAISFMAYLILLGFDVKNDDKKIFTGLCEIKIVPPL